MKKITEKRLRRGNPELWKVPFPISVLNETKEKYMALAKDRRETARKAFEKAVDEEYGHISSRRCRNKAIEIRDELDAMFEDESILSSRQCIKNPEKQVFFFEEMEIWLDFKPVCELIVLPTLERSPERTEVFLLKEIYKIIYDLGMDENYYTVGFDDDNLVDIRVDFDKYIDVTNGNMLAKFIAKQE